jgi:uncharacterized RDD family membrane protein YckC
VTYPPQQPGQAGQPQSWSQPGYYTQPAQPPISGPPGGYVPPAQFGPPQQMPPPGYQVPRPPLPKPTAPDGRPLAEFMDRFLAFLIDMAVYVVVSIIGLFFIFQSKFEGSTVADDGTFVGPSAWDIMGPILAFYGAIFILSSIFSYIYEVEMVLRRGGTTWGKKAMKLQIVPLDDPSRPLTRQAVTKRWLVWYVLGIVVPFFRWIDGLWQLWDQPYKQCLHDKWAGTVVVKVAA